MANARIVYIIALAFALMFYFVYPLWLAWYLLVLVVIILPFDLIVSLPGMITRRITVSSPAVIEQNSEDKLRITVRPTHRFPSGYLKLLLREVTEESTIAHRIVCSANAGSCYDIVIDTSHCGLVIFEIRSFNALSIMRLFSFKRKMDKRVRILIMPKPLMPPNMSTLPRANALVPKLGGGYSEEHDIRPYRQGDPKNSIHWKLSAKFDSLIIREALESPPHSRLVKCAQWRTPYEREIILARLRWISEYLLSHDCPHFVRIGENVRITEIVSNSDLYEFLINALDYMAVQESVSLPHFTWVFVVDASETKV